MIRVGTFLTLVTLGCGLCYGQSAPTNVFSLNPDAQLRTEQGHFLQCLAFVYQPSRWMSYGGALYFWPHSEADLERLDSMKAERSKYLTFTNRLDRHKLAARTLGATGLDETWQKKVLLPYSDTNQNLTPTFARTVRWLPKYELLKTFGGGDVLISDDDAAYFVIEFGRAVDDALRTNAILVREGTKSFKSPAGETVAVEAFTDAGLNREETAILRRISAAFSKAAAELDRTNLPAPAIATTRPAASQTSAPDRHKAVEFEMHQARATDASPYMEYLLARDYLEGFGTKPDEKLGMEWMRRAAKSGSGDARAFLERSVGAVKDR